MCSSFGQDVLDSLFASLTTSRSSRMTAAIRSIATTVIALFYVVFHEWILLVRVITLNVAVNSFDQAVFVLFSDISRIQPKHTDKVSQYPTGFRWWSRISSLSWRALCSRISKRRISFRFRVPVCLHSYFENALLIDYIRRCRAIPNCVLPLHCDWI